MSRRLRSRWRLAGALMALLALGILAGCGSSSSSTSTSASTSTPAAATGSATTPSTADSGSAVATAKKIVAAAEGTAAYGPDAGDITPSDITPATEGAIKATPYKAGTDPKTAITISCASISAICERQATLEAAALNKVGWKATKMSAGNDYSVQSFQRAMTTAIAKKPYAIITNGMAGVAITAQLAAAKKAGIFMLGTSVNEASGAGYDQYNPNGYSLGQSVTASEVIADLGENANSHWFDIPQFPFLELKRGVSFGQSICSTCTFSTSNITAAVGVDPVAFGSLTTATVNANPKVQALVWPGEVPLQASAQAIQKSSNPKVAQYTTAFESAIAQSLKQGIIPAMTGYPVAWSAILSVDLTLRHATGLPVLPENEPKIGIMIMRKDQVPTGELTESAIDKWALSKFDFLAPYSKAWGVDLSTII